VSAGISKLERVKRTPANFSFLSSVSFITRVELQSPPTRTTISFPLPSSTRLDTAIVTRRRLLEEDESRFETLALFSLFSLSLAFPVLLSFVPFLYWFGLWVSFRICSSRLFLPPTFTSSPQNFPLLVWLRPKPTPLTRFLIDSSSSSSFIFVPLYLSIVMPSFLDASHTRGQQSGLFSTILPGGEFDEEEKLESSRSSAPPSGGVGSVAG